MEKNPNQPKHLCQVALLCPWLILGRIEDQMASLWTHLSTNQCELCDEVVGTRASDTKYLPACSGTAMQCFPPCWQLSPGIHLEEQKDQTSSLFFCIRLLLFLPTAPRERSHVYFHVVSPTHLLEQAMDPCHLNPAGIPLPSLPTPFKSMCPCWKVT